MKFLDYEKIIREHYPMLIESYVRQYGETYRKRITEVLDRAKYCIFVTPSNIKEYVERKSSEDYMKAILETYCELGLDISTFEIDEDGLIFNDEKLGTLTEALFPNLTDVEMFKKSGIFAFDSIYDSLDVNDPMIVERMKLLEKLNKKDVNVSNEEYFKSEDYQEGCLGYSTILSILKEKLDYYVDDYSEILAYADEIDSSVSELGHNLEKEYMIGVKKFLSKHDQKLIESGNFSLTDLECYDLFFDLELEKDDYYFSEGPIDYFLDSYTESLMDPEVSRKEKDVIVKMRFKYLEHMGYDTSKLKVSSLFCDWYKRDDLVKLLPKKEDLQEIAAIKDELCIQFEYECAKLCVINNYDLRIDDVEIETILDENGHSCSVNCHDEKIDPKKFSCVICLNPFMDSYNLFDIAIDHELRHAIEMRMKKSEKRIVLKTGCDIATFDKNFENGRSTYTDLNERITQRLSVDATVDRWIRGEFIFSDKYALLTSYPLSIYDLDLDNLEIIFEPFREKIIEAQISPNFRKIYETIPKCEMRKINELVTKHDKKTTRKLNAIRSRLLTREEEMKQNKNNSSTKTKKRGAKHGKNSNKH